MILATALTFVMLNCPAVFMDNKTDEPFTKMDHINFEHAKNRCVVHYKDAPCLKKFTKIGFQNYHAICGRGE